jgi:hypothetical protein
VRVETLPRLVTVIWGPIAKELDIRGMTVDGAYRALRVPLNIPARVRPLVNGRVAGPGERLSPGDVLEFVRAAGEKGAADKR